MWKVLLVEDESTTRRGLREKVNWQKFNMQIVAEAEDGLEGSRMARLHRPDLSILDVRMPRMDGIACAEAIRTMDTQCVIVFVSGFCDKEYLKAAIHLGALEYIEKPLQIPAVEEMLKRVQTLLESRGSATDDQGKLILYRQLAHLYMKEVPREQITRKLMEQLHLKAEGGYGFAAVIVRLVHSKAPESNAGYMLQYEQAIAKAMAGWRGFLLYAQWQPNQIVLHCELSEPADALLDRLDAALQEANGEFGIQLCLGKTVGSLKRLNLSAQDALKKQAAAFLFPENAHIRRLSHTKTAEGWHNVTFQKLCEYVEQKNRQAFLTLMNEAEAVMTNSHSPQDLIHHMWLLATVFRWLLQRYMKLADYASTDRVPIHGNMADVCQYGCLRTACKLILSLFEEYLMMDQRLTGHSLAVRASIQYITMHYQDDISLDSIADAVNLSKNYLGGIFKGETGLTIRQFIENTRIDASKRLMADPACKLFSVAEQVGFNSYSYFVNVFKRNMGVTPNEFRKRC